MQSGIERNSLEHPWMAALSRDLRECSHCGLVSNPAEIKAAQAATEFVRTVVNVIERHLSDYKFNIQALAADLRMSRRQLFRKFNAYAGCTPNVFIRNLRLKRAAELLRNTRLTVLEITYAVGFCDPKYFRGIFRNKYGMLPSVYAKQSANGSV